MAKRKINKKSFAIRAFTKEDLFEQIKGVSIRVAERIMKLLAKEF